MSKSLTVTPTPYRSSRLAIPPSPFSPQLPPAPPPKRAVAKAYRTNTLNLALPAPPSRPLNWLWQCHLCSRIYQLGVTRRCLDDGHYFCAGAPVTKRDRKTGKVATKKGRACASEFDYAGWKAWGGWRRDCAEQIAAAEALAALDREEEEEDKMQPKPLFAPSGPEESDWLRGHWARKPAGIEQGKLWAKDCWGTCDYPSECRWGRQYGVQQVQTQAQNQQAANVAKVADEKVPDGEVPKTSFDEILLGIPGAIAEEDSDSEVEMLDASSSPPAEETSSLSPTEVSIKKPTLDDLLESAKRRKRRSSGAPPSPLASNSPSAPEAAKTDVELVGKASESMAAHSLQKALDDFELDVKKGLGKASELFRWGKKASKGDEEAGR